MFGFGNDKDKVQGTPIPANMMIDWKCSCGNTFVDMKMQLKVYPGGLYGSPQVIPVSSTWCTKCGKMAEIDIKKIKAEQDQNHNQLKLIED